VFVNATEHNLLAHFGGDNDGVNGSGNVYEFNSFGEEGEGFIRWGWDQYDRYNDWEVVYGHSSKSVTEDPRLVGSTPTTLYLAPDSPCIDTGRALEQQFDEGLLQETTWVDGVETAQQDLYGSGWDIGAYVYFSRTRRIQSPPQRLIPTEDSAIKTAPPLRHQ